jgi:type IV fimbrial biogenesis protein FimT
MNSIHRSLGLTLIETLVVMALIAILMGLAVPSLAAFQRSSELRAAASSFQAAVQNARAEAMKRGIDTYVMPLTENDWTRGWTVFADADRSQSLTGNDVLIHQTGALSGKTSVTPGLAEANQFDGATTKFIRFNGGGFPVDLDGSFRGGAIEFGVQGTEEKRRVVLNAVGRVRVCDPGKDRSEDCRQPVR